MECGHRCLKYLLFAFNFLFWVLGIVVLGVGIYSRIKGGNYDTILGEGGFASAANILIASGVFVSLIGFVGCCGALKESKVMLIIYFILVLLIFILEIAAGALAYTKKDLMEKHLKDNLSKFVHTNYGAKNPDESQKAVDVAVDWFQEKVKCCGATGPKEWMDSAWRKTGTGSTNTTLAPDSCCILKAKNCAVALINVWPKGCVDQGKQFVKDHMWQVGGVGVGIAVIQLLVMIAAIALCRNISKEGNLA
jgi:hypothetical protein